MKQWYKLNTFKGKNKPWYDFIYHSLYQFTWFFCIFLNNNVLRNPYCKFFIKVTCFCHISNILYCYFYMSDMSTKYYNFFFFWLLAMIMLFTYTHTLYQIKNLIDFKSCVNIWWFQRYEFTSKELIRPNCILNIKCWSNAEKRNSEFMECTMNQSNIGLRFQRWKSSWTVNAWTWNQIFWIV